MSDLIERLKKGTEHQVWVLVDETVDEVKRLTNELREARAALEEIAEGKGRYSTDPLTHAENTIEDMSALAVEALANKQSSTCCGDASHGCMVETE